jgi:hypothetical protein
MPSIFDDPEAYAFSDDKEEDLRRKLTNQQAFNAMLQGVGDLPYSLLGAPVEIGTGLLRSMGMAQGEQVGGIDYIKRKATELGIRPPDSTDPTMRDMRMGAEIVSGAIDPTRVARVGGVAATAAARKAAPMVGNAIENYMVKAGLAPRIVPEGGLLKRDIPVKPSTDDVYEVMESSFDFGKVGANKNMSLEDLIGGVRMNDPKEAQRVNELAQKMSSPDGYVSRILVDDLGNVLEGQHRLEALRLLGEKNAPVTIIQDLSNKYNISEMKQAISGQMRSDQSNQLIREAIDALEDSGSVEKALAEYSMPSYLQKPFEDAIKASKITPVSGKSAAPQTEALKVAQSNAALPVEQGGLGLPANNTPMDRAKAMGFDVDTIRYHGSDVEIHGFDPKKFGKNDQGWYGRGVTTDTDPEIAAGYADYNQPESGQVIYPLLTKGKYMNWPDGQPPFSSAKDAIAGTKDMQNLGYSGTRITNDRDLYGSTPDFGTEQVTFQPQNVRSVNAAFDPLRKNDADLLAGIGAGGLLAVDDETKQKVQSLLGYSQ